MPNLLAPILELIGVIYGSTAFYNNAYIAFGLAFRKGSPLTKELTVQAQSLGIY